jgi:hypothetical protein
VVNNYARYHAGVWGSGGTASCSVNYGIDGRESQLHYPATVLPRKEPLYPLHRKLCGPKIESRSAHTPVYAILDPPKAMGNLAKTNFLLCLESNPGRPAHTPVTDCTILDPLMVIRKKATTGPMPHIVPAARLLYYAEVFPENLNSSIKHLRELPSTTNMEFRITDNRSLLHSA